jgi:hypothetical protein
VVREQLAVLCEALEMCDDDGALHVAVLKLAAKLKLAPSSSNRSEPEPREEKQSVDARTVASVNSVQTPAVPRRLSQYDLPPTVSPPPFSFPDLPPPAYAASPTHTTHTVDEEHDAVIEVFCSDLSKVSIHDAQREEVAESKFEPENPNDEQPQRWAEEGKIDFASPCPGEKKVEIESPCPGERKVQIDTLSSERKVIETPSSERKVIDTPSSERKVANGGVQLGPEREPWDVSPVHRTFVNHITASPSPERPADRDRERKVQVDVKDHIQSDSEDDLLGERQPPYGALKPTELSEMLDEEALDLFGPVLISGEWSAAGRKRQSRRAQS